MKRRQYLLNRVDKLIEDGDKFNFSNNSYYVSGERYGRVSDELNAWKAEVEQLILKNYGEYSGPYKMLDSGNFQSINGNYESAFQRETSIVKGAIRACKNLPQKIVKKPKESDDSEVIYLIKSKIFWSVSVVISGAAFALGMYFGKAKFDSEKNSLYEENRELRIENKSLNDRILKLNDSIVSFSE